MPIDREIKIKEIENNFKTLKIKYKELLWNLKKNNWSNDEANVNYYTVSMIGNIIKIRECFGLNSNFIDLSGEKK